MEIDETALKTAIRGLTDRLTIKPEHWLIFLQNIALVKESCVDVDSERDYWRKLFDGQGATNALNKSFYTQETVRLLTLRAIALPETLPDLLIWLKMDSSNNEYINISFEFQRQLQLSEHPDIEKLIVEGGRNLISKIFIEPKYISLKSALFLLLNPSSIWAKYRLEYAKELKDDIQVLSGQQAHNHPNYKFSFSADLYQYWQPDNAKHNKKFIILVELFKELKDFQLAACFHQLSYGYVPKSLFIAAFPKYDDLVSFYDLPIRQKGYNFKGGKIIVPIKYVVAISVIMLSLGLRGGFMFGINLPNTEKIDEARKLVYMTALEEKQRLVNAINNFSATEESLNTIYSFSIGCFSASEIQVAIKETLSTKDIKFNNPYTLQAIEIVDWIDAISQYQNDRKITADGVINKDGVTYKLLFDEVSQKLRCPYD